MIQKIIKFFWGDRSEREMKKMLPRVEEINTIYKTLVEKSDDELRIRVQDIKNLIQDEINPIEDDIEKLQEKYQTEIDDKKKQNLSNELDEINNRLKDTVKTLLDSNLNEVFAIVKDTCRRLLGFKYEVRGHEMEWNMVPFDVQLIGGIVLHEGMIAEMATGEGKTLVSTMPLFLNALTGRGVHLITVNDYLAYRDAEWMKPIFDFHNISIGVIYNNMDQNERKIAYQADITYGTNSEFGFDYLRDNMATSAERLVQRNHFFVIIDEVDSVLIDEARTPLIISGPVSESKNFYSELKPLILELVYLQNNFVKRLLMEVKDDLNSDNPDYRTIGDKLLQIRRASPKNKAFLKFMKEGELKKIVNDAEGEYIREKKLHELDEKLYYAVDEKSNNVDLSEKGRKIFSQSNSDLFVVKQLDDIIEEINVAGDLTEEEKNEKRKIESEKYFDKNEKIHNIAQLLKAYSLFEKDVDYVVQDNKVMIVDEFTGRMMPGRRFSDGLHQALESKESVQIEQATQTLATITLQNYFKKYDKLAGMTGTAITEENEFLEIYKLSVMVIPTNVEITRVDHEDKIYLTKNDKYNAIIDEIEYWNKLSKPVLVGTVSVEVSEILSRFLRRKGIKHHVLNAKYHEKEAEIITNAGQPGSVTIATNMAGRGTDIKLGVGVVTESHEYYVKEKAKISDNNIYGIPLDGLHVIGTERHESRRIDRQLRGRAGRQGDPGTSRFYLSLEDDLMRLFGSDRIAPMMTKLGLKEGEAITHSWMTKTVEGAQKKVEGFNFGIRKQLIKYDEVMNQQREVIYSYRRNVLKGYDLNLEVIEMIKEAVYNNVNDIIISDYPEEWPLDRLVKWMRYDLNINIGVNPFSDLVNLTEHTILERVEEIVLGAYDNREKQLGSDKMREIERRSLLMVVDDEWRDHLHEMDLLKEGIGFRAYAQKDPLIEYKKEGYILFEGLIARIQSNVTKSVFTLQLYTQEEIESLIEKAKLEHAEVTAFTNPEKINPKESMSAPKAKPIVNSRKIGRNEPCPCGSGKKYKKCCGRNINENDMEL